MTAIDRRAQPVVIEKFDQTGLDGIQQNFEALFGDNVQGLRLNEFEGELAELVDADRSYLTTDDEGALSVQEIPIPATDGGTGHVIFVVGDLLSADTTTSLSRVAAVAAGRVLRAAGTSTLPAYSAFTIPNTFAQGDTVYASAADTLTALPKDTNATRSLTNTGASNNPAWAQVNLANGVSGDLPFANLVPATAASKLVGRGAAAGAGDFEEVTLGTGLTMTGTTLSGSAGGGVGGSDTQVQFNDAGAFAGDAGLTYNKTTDVLSVGAVTLADAGNIVVGSSTGTKIGTATSQKLGFYNATPVVQGASVADATGGAIIDAEARTAINALISRIEALGLIATV